MANINETIAEVEKLNPELAKQLKRYVKDHSYGLVFEQNLPDSVRLWTKKPAKYDKVNILPPRGEFDTEENYKEWYVSDIVDGTATLVNGEEVKLVSVEDIVPVVGHKDVIYPGLKVIDKVERGNSDDPYHMVINAENYHALEALCYAYAGKVDCIYIDPPYNTGAKDWKYNNDYVGKEDSYRHSKWLAMMERRLMLAKKLLSINGVLIVTIDDNEYSRLLMLLEQLYPEYLQDTVCVQMNPGGTQGDAISVTNEFMIFVYSKDSRIYRKPHLDGDTYNLRRWGSTSTRYEGATCFYPIYVDKNDNVLGFGDVLSDNLHPSSQVEACNDGSYIVWPIDKNNIERKWRYARDTVNSVKDRMFVVHNGDRIEIMLRRADEPMKTMWVSDAYNSESHGSKLLKSIIGKDKFSYPKSLFAVRDALYHCTSGKKDALIIDFFAGSGTTLHATSLLNAEDGGKRRCILVTNNEVSEEEQNDFIKRKLRPSDNEWMKFGIANYVTWTRTKCVIEGVDITGSPLHGNYGCEVETFVEYENDVIDADSGKKIRGTVYKKKKMPLYPSLSKLNLSDGFKENAVFCELTYENLWDIRLDRAFNAVAPILWMLAGCKGSIIEKLGKGYATTNNYAVLFKYDAVSKLVEAIKNKPSIEHVFVVTDDQQRYLNVINKLNMIKRQNIHRLYESYLRSFEIVGEGGLD